LSAPVSRVEGPDSPVFSTVFPEFDAFSELAMDDRDKRAIDELQAQVDALNARRGTAEKSSAQAKGRDTGQMGMGFRISVEMLATLAVGTGMGYVLDRWLGTSPWLTLVFLVLGAAAGMRNAIKVATRMSAKPDETKRP
jgi:ATP synthase protein I